jgi:hypothetical protein
LQRPLVLSLCRPLVLLSSSDCAALLLSCASWLLCRLSLQRPLVLSLCRPLVLLSSSDCAALLLSHLTAWLLRRLSLHRPLIVLSLRRSCCLAPASCCIASRCAALSWSSHCATLSLSHLTSWLLHRLSSCRPLVILLLLCSFIILRWLVVALPLVAPPSSPLVILYLELIEPGFLDPFGAIFIRNCPPDCRKGCEEKGQRRGEEVRRIRR